MSPLKLASPVVGEARAVPNSPQLTTQLLARPVSGILPRGALLAGLPPNETCSTCAGQIEPCDNCLTEHLRQATRPAPPLTPSEGCEDCRGDELCANCLAKRTHDAVCFLVGKDPNA